MPTTLSGRERFIRALERRDHDRVPRYDQLWPETLARWRSEGMTSEPRDQFGYDLEMTWIGFIEPFPGGERLVAETETTKDVVRGWGQKLRYFKNATTTPTHLGYECQDRAIWESRFKPALLARAGQIDVQLARTIHTANRQAGRFSAISIVLSYEVIKAMLGDETMLIAFAEDPDWIKDISTTVTDVMIQCLDTIIVSGGVDADALWMFEDLAYKNGPLCSPAMYRELVWPDHKRMTDYAHRKGMKLIFHTDGDIRSYMDLLLAAGFDALQPLEAKASVDIRLLAPRYGSRVSFMGNIDMMVACTNDPQKVEEEVVSKLAAGMANKGYIYHSDHSVPPGVSWATYQQIMSLVDRHGNYI